MDNIKPYIQPINARIEGEPYQKLGEHHLLNIYRDMVLCRTLDQRLWVLNRQGKAAIVASAQGHEAAQIGSALALEKGHDFFYIYYRDLAVLIGLGVKPSEVIRSFMAKAGEVFSGARQFPLHGAYPKFNVINISNVVGTQIPQAVGAALASKIRGDHKVAIVYFGDGGSSVGDCHEAMNFAAVHRLPIIFFCENNKYAISVHISKQMAVESIASRANGYNMRGICIDGTDIEEVYEATAEAALIARAGKGPTIVEAVVERCLPHTSDDDDRRYRTKKDIENTQQRDPIKLLQNRLTSAGSLSKNMDKKIQADALKEVNQATDLVEREQYPHTDGFHNHVYAARPK